MVGFTHNYLWLTSKPKHTQECSSGGEWFKTALACGQPFYNSRNQNVKWDSREMLIVSEGLHSSEQYFPWWIFLVLAMKACPLTSSNQSCLPPSSSIFPQIFCQVFPIILPVNVLWVWGWADVEHASCLYSAYSLQPKTGERQAKQRPQVQPVLRVPGLFSAWQNIRGTLLTLTDKTGYPSFRDRLPSFTRINILVLNVWNLVK